MANKANSADHSLTIAERYEQLVGPRRALPLDFKINQRAACDKLFGEHVVDFLGDHLPWGSYGRVAIQLFRSKAPCVYFIGGDAGAIKIGTTIAPLERLAMFQMGSPIKLRILALVEGDRTVERAYHSRFGLHHSHGEWFDPHPDILAEIERLNQEQPRG